MSLNIRLHSSELHYGPGVELHTSSSGSISHLRELYLLLKQDGRLCGLGGIRTNISYLTGASAKSIEDQAIVWATKTDWTQGADTLLDRLHQSSTLTAPVRALFDQTLHDAKARSYGIPLCMLWDVPISPQIESNQTLFWCDDVALIENAERYVERGFKNLKLRMGIGSFKEDVNRLYLLRERFGSAIKLSADVNGKWPDDKAIFRITALEEFTLDYLEQPVSASSWKILSKLAEKAPMTIMLDESVKTSGDVERIISIGGRLAAHLKLVKCGGMRPLIRAGCRLIKAGIPVMIGQMNEGTLATAAAAHCALVLNTTGNELYGADGLIDDPAYGLKYAEGQLHLPKGPGLGVAFNPSNIQTLWEKTINANTKTNIKSKPNQLAM